MKFIKLRVKNFKPYYESSTNPQEIVLFDEGKKNRNVTLNIGPTGNGKTSISEAILWCLFGDDYNLNWEEWVNTLSINIAKQKKENEVDMIVELLLEIKGQYYKLIRSGRYDIENQRKEDESDLSIIHNGEPIQNPTKFIKNKFPTVELMEYFVFDADDILKKFEANRGETIKDTINKIVGVEKLDNMINSLRDVMELYDNEIRSVEGQIHDDIADKINEKEKDREIKNETVRKLEGDVKKLEKEKRNLLKKSSSSTAKRFTDLVNKRDFLETKTGDLNKEFKKNNIISNLDLLLLDCVVEDTIKKLNQKQTTKGEFETSIKIIKSSLGNNYCGIFLDGKENPHLIKKKAKILDRYLDGLEKLGLESGEGIKTETLKTFGNDEWQIERLKTIFKKQKDVFDKTIKELMVVRNKINYIGDTTKNRALKERYEKFIKIEQRIKEKKKVQIEIQDTIREVEQEIEELRNQLVKNKEQEYRIQQIEEMKQSTKILLDITKRARGEFLKDLLSYVNKAASELFRNTVREIDRFHSIEVDANYQFKVRQKNGELIGDSQINRGNLQTSMMSFFFGLSKFLGKEIPYVIDDPLIRFDPGYDKRIIKQLSKSNEQLIFHMIPGKEYTSHSFNWLRTHINIQNWLYRKKYKNMEFISYVERKDASKIVDFDIDKF